MVDHKHPGIQDEACKEDNAASLNTFGRYESLKKLGVSEAVMQKEDNDEDKVSISSSVRLTDSTAGN
jgi:hypothetical protein